MEAGDLTTKRHFFRAESRHFSDQIQTRVATNQIQSAVVTSQPIFVIWITPQYNAGDRATLFGI